MDRANAMTIKLTKFPNVDFGSILNELSCETAWGYQTDFKKYDIIWVDKGVPKVFFKYVEYFNWIPNFNGGSGKSAIWYNDKTVTKDNYRTAVCNDEGEIESYTYLDYSEMTDVAPISKDEESLIV